MVLKNNDKKEHVLLHACCGICSGYPITLLQELGYVPIVYFCNPNIDTDTEFKKRLLGQKTVCESLKVDLIEEKYDHDLFLNTIKGLEKEPEKGLRCNKCIELRMYQSVQKSRDLGIKTFTTSLSISPHKNFQLITSIGEKLAKNFNLTYLDINFRKHDGFLKTNNISKKLKIYRQNYCGCEFGQNK